MTERLWDIDRLEILRDLKTPLDEYIQRKSDFIAEVTTEPTLSTRSAFFFREIVSPLVRNTALIDSIARNEGFGYSTWHESSLSVRCFIHSDEIRNVYPADPQAKQPVPYAERRTAFPTYAMDGAIENENRDVRVALPGPVGEMALYGILENVIRNSAKHGGGDPKKDALELQLRLRELPVGDIGRDDYFEVVLLDRNSSPSDEVLATLRRYLERDIVNDDGRTRKEAWGLAEMAICASFLAGRTSFDHTKHGLTVHRSNERELYPNTPPCLAYRFRMMKAKTALMLGYEEPVAGAFMESGFRFVPDIKGFVAEDGGSQALAAFQFAVVKLASYNELLQRQQPVETSHWLKLRQRLPFRIIVVGKASGEDGLRFTADDPPLQTGPAGVVPWLWRTWLGMKRWDSLPTGVDVFLEQSEKENPTGKLFQAATDFNRANDNAYRMDIWGTISGGNRRTKALTDAGRTRPANSLVFDRHASLAGEYAPFERDTLWEFIEKRNEDFDALFNPDLSAPWVLPYQLIEAARLRVLVIDERIAQRAMETPSDWNMERVPRVLLRREGRIPVLWHLARAAGISIVTRLSGLATKDKSAFDLHLGELSYRRLKDDFDREQQKKLTFPSLHLHATDPIAYLGMRIFGDEKQEEKPSCGDFDIAIIHQGILDRMNGSAGVTPSKFIKRLRKAGIPWIALESGRGIPLEVLDSNEKFIPFSALERIFGGGRVAKLELTQRLMELTRRRTQ